MTKWNKNILSDSNLLLARFPGISKIFSSLGEVKYGGVSVWSHGNEIYHCSENVDFLLDGGTMSWQPGFGKGRGVNILIKSLMSCVGKYNYLNWI